MARRPSRAAKRVRSKGGRGGRRAASRGKATAHYTPPTVSTKQSRAQKDIPIRGILGSIVMNETRRPR